MLLLSGFPYIHAHGYTLLTPFCTSCFCLGSFVSFPCDSFYDSPTTAASECTSVWSVWQCFCFAVTRKGCFLRRWNFRSVVHFLLCFEDAIPLLSGSHRLTEKSAARLTWRRVFSSPGGLEGSGFFRFSSFCLRQFIGFFLFVCFLHGSFLNSQLDTVHQVLNILRYHRLRYRSGPISPPYTPLFLGFHAPLFCSFLYFQHFFLKKRLLVRHRGYFCPCIFRLHFSVQPAVRPVPGVLTQSDCRVRLQDFCFILFYVPVVWSSPPSSLFP